MEQDKILSTCTGYVCFKLTDVQFWLALLPQWRPHRNSGDWVWPKADQLQQTPWHVLGEPWSNTVCLSPVHVCHLLPQQWAEASSWGVARQKAEAIESEDCHQNHNRRDILQCWRVTTILHFLFFYFFCIFCVLRETCFVASNMQHAALPNASRAGRLNSTFLRVTWILMLVISAWDRGGVSTQWPEKC